MYEQPFEDLKSAVFQTLVRPSVNLCGDFKVTNIRVEKISKCERLC